jgi:hypothetical protein
VPADELPEVPLPLLPPAPLVPAAVPLSLTPFVPAPPPARGSDGSLEQAQRPPSAAQAQARRFRAPVVAAIAL